jgi:hypothetical protein
MNGFLIDISVIVTYGALDTELLVFMVRSVVGHQGRERVPSMARQSPTLAT